ncbi:FMN-dependent NADH-azoreductase [Pectobacterium versatile]|uniref:FMN dependent NADH:quinone oxidoreductase n=1 Tax=Pectobacterium versatile TaxID=2488639 RepID=A0A855MHE2_9GAMM|nr:NAD(P)H-dependent oxidoreductase [Pectobacterium versatile]POY48808.1 FMN-dependent NADH-azoreductase [Pectobacterium versatile]QPK17092.1 NAD(P)H-dependent oxidoreductase [Pectobacterium versatile]
MRKILLITSSPRGTDSLSTRFANEIATGIRMQLGGSLNVRDLAANPTPHITSAYIKGRVIAPDVRTAEETEAVERAMELVDELRAADVIVLGTGMINFGPSSQLKAWIDHITWPGITFSYETGVPHGLLAGKKVYLVTAAGGVFSEGEYAPYDFQTNYLLHMLGFVGLTDVELIRIEGTVLGPEATQAALEKAEATVKSLLATMA